MTNNLYKDLTSAMLGPIFDLKNVVKGLIKGEGKDKIKNLDPRKNGGGAQVVNMMLKNKDVGKTAKGVGKLGFKIGRHGIIGGVKDKAKYIGGKFIRPKTFEARGLYGNTIVGKAADAVKSAAHPVGKTGENKK